ncbi:hypothetical protein TYRP_015818, partial [Tyrophagus putrescentiae]
DNVLSDRLAKMLYSMANIDWCHLVDRHRPTAWDTTRKLVVPQAVGADQPNDTSLQHLGFIWLEEETSSVSSASGSVKASTRFSTALFTRSAAEWRSSEAVGVYVEEEMGVEVSLLELFSPLPLALLREDLR